MSQPSFRHFDPGCRVVYGDDCLRSLPSETRRLGARRVAVFCGRTLSQSLPGLETIREILGENYAGAFTGVVEQSPLPSVEAATQFLREVEADALVVLGGGSAVVTARAAAILHGEGKSIFDLCTTFAAGGPPQSPRLDKPKLPQFVVPTTPTTAYAKSGAAVTIPGEGRRLALFDPKARAQTLFIDPAFIEATPARLMLDSSLDAFAQAVQGLESKRREPLADAMLMHGVRLIHGALAVDQGERGARARRDLMIAAQLIGQGTDFTGAGLISAIGHALGARFQSGNGHFKSVILPHALAYNAVETAGRLDELAVALGCPSMEPRVVADACRTFFDKLGLPTQLRELNVPRDALPLVAQDAMEDWFLTQNPRSVSRAGLEQLLTEAW